MTEDQQLQLQAFSDGELKGRGAREVAAWVARDPEAAALLKELRNTREALKGFAPQSKVPVSRELYWPGIERRIRTVERERAPSRSPEFLSMLRRLLMPASALAALLLIVTIAGLQSGLFQSAHKADTETAMADSGTFTYQDYASGTTLVWVGYPAER
ncbi:MAG TPA: hypothetical protein VFD66_08750 [Verrucomicrobiae bacterium]|nr:hypothetical protein [Verrucomicrobiae bacterium]